MISGPLLESTTNAQVAEDEHVECSELVLPVNLVPTAELKECDLSISTPSSSNMTKELKRSRWSITVRSLRSKVMQNNAHNELTISSGNEAPTSVMIDKPWTCDHGGKGLMDSCREKVRQWSRRIKQEDRREGQACTEEFTVATLPLDIGTRRCSAACIDEADEMFTSSLTRSFASAIDRLD